MSSLTNPLYLLGPPLLLLISIPLTILATVTTTIAVTTLAVRVSIVYCELGVALIHSYLFPPLQKPAPHRPLPNRPSPNRPSPNRPSPNRPSPKRSSPHRARHRRSSITSTSSSHDTAVPASHPPRLHNKSGSFASLIGTGEITRDFEGVGGWRVPGDEDEEALWMGMNSRLELPAVMPKQRKHQRSLTGASQRWSTGSSEIVRMSPMQSRAWTPAGEERYSGESPGYFPPQPNMRRLSAASSNGAGKSTQDGRRKSSSTSSTGGSSPRIVMR